MSNTTITKAESWRNRLKAQQASGLSQAKYCATHGIAVNTFLYWKRKLETGQVKSFVRITGVHVQRRHLTIIHPDGVRVVLAPDAPEGLAKALLEAMRAN